MIKEKKKLKSYIFALSFLMIFFTYEGSFNVQSLLPFVILLIFDILVNKKTKLRFDSRSRLLALFVGVLCVSSIISMFRYSELISFNVIIGILYFLVIFLWFYLCTNEYMNSAEIKLINRVYVFTGTLCSILLIKRFLNGQLGKIAMINFIGTEIDENHVSALIAVVTVYIFMSILLKKTSIKGTIVKVILFSLNFFGVAISGSRASLISTVAAIILLFFIVFFQKLTIKKFFSLVLSILVLIFIGSKIINFLPEWTYNRYFSNNYMDSSNTTRINIWKNAVNGILSQPLLGYGIGFFENIDEYKYVNGTRIPERVPAHHTFLDITLYTGIIGLIIFALFLWSILKQFLHGNGKVFLPIILVIFLISNILGAEKSAFFWNNIILLVIIANYLKKSNRLNDILV